MSSGSHNKKRNCALLYEFLLQTISRSLVEGDERKSNVALRILKRHFKPGSELYKEFRLINSLVKTTVSSEAVAASILQEAKLAARSHDASVLDREKSSLIHSINYGINDDNFYDQQINEYRMYATFQTLVNDWRSSDRNIERIARYEDQLVKWLSTEKPTHQTSIISEDTPGTSRLLMKILTKKLNEKYAGVLNEEQRSLVRVYAFSTATDDPESIMKKLVEIRRNLLEAMDAFDRRGSTNEFLNKKIVEVRERVEGEMLEAVDDDTVTRFMLYTKLAQELGIEDKDV